MNGHVTVRTAAYVILLSLGELRSFSWQLDRFCCRYRIGGPIFFANVDKFVDRLYAEVLRPSDVQQSSAVCLVVPSDYHPDLHHHEFDDDSGKLTMSQPSDDIEMNGVLRHTQHATHGGCECTDERNSNSSLETPDGSYTTPEDDAQPSLHHRHQNFDNGKVHVIVLDCCKVTDTPFTRGIARSSRLNFCNRPHIDRYRYALKAHDVCFKSAHRAGLMFIVSNMIDRPTKSIHFS